MRFTNLFSLTAETCVDIVHFFTRARGRARILRLGALILLLSGGAFAYAALSEGADSTNTEEAPQSVQLITAAEFQSTERVSYVGRVAALAEANLKSEVGGRVVSVPVSLGDRVAAGATIAVLENAAERAAVLQAEGAYEAALANAAQSDVGVARARIQLADAEKNALATYQSAYATTNSVVLNTVDLFFSDPQGRVPGLYVDGPAHILNQMRVELQRDLPSWQSNLTRNIANDEIDRALNEALSTVSDVITVLDYLAEAIVNEQADAEIHGVLVSSYLDDVTSARGTLTTTLQSIRSAQANLADAREALRTAEIGGTGSGVSSANAQVKQAAGSLAAARARLADTVITAPVSGTVTTLQVRAGDYIQAFSDIGRVSSTDGFEITLEIGRSDRDRFTVGDTVQIDNAITGTVSEVAPGIDRTTGTLTVRITANGELSSGDTVTVSATSDAQTASDARVVVPVTALKFVGGEALVLTVTDGTVVSVPVQIGDVRGDAVQITEGLDARTPFIRDARGISAGTRVTVATE